MSTNARIAAVIALIAVAVAAFIALSPGDDDETATTPTTTQSTSTTTTQSSTTTAATPIATTTPTIRVTGGQPAGGVKKMTVKKGDQIRFRVVDDRSEHVHLHGYDIEKPVGPGNPASYSVPATITGVFEIEIEDTGVQIGKLTVEP